MRVSLRGAELILADGTKLGTCRFPKDRERNELLTAALNVAFKQIEGLKLTDLAKFAGDKHVFDVSWIQRPGGPAECMILYKIDPAVERETELIPLLQQSVEERSIKS